MATFPLNQTGIMDFRNISDTSTFSQHILQSHVFAVLCTIASPMIIPTLLFTTSWKLWDWYNIGKQDPESKLPLPPGSFGIPFIGETLNLILGGSLFFHSRRSKYGHVYKTHLLGNPTIRIMGAQNVKKILTGEDTLVTTKWPTSTRLILGEGGVALSTGILHKMKRKILCKGFTHEALCGYVEPIHNIIRSQVNSWCNAGFIMGYPQCKSMMFTIAGKVLLGFDFESIEKTELTNTFQEMITNIFSLPINVPGLGLNKGLKARDIIMEKIEEAIKRRQKSTDTSCKDTLSILLDTMAKDGETLTHQELKEVALEMLFAGHETTASAACSTIYHLAKEPMIIERIFSELYENDLLDDSRSLDLTIINQLTYTGNVVKEVLRMTPPIGGGFRKALKTFEIDGYQVPKDWTVTYCIRDTHEMSSIFEEGDKFNPDRWQHWADVANTDKYDYIPFGGGARTCVGKDIAKLILKIFIIELVRKCSWDLMAENTTILPLPVPHPKDNLPLHFRPSSASRARAYSM